MASAFLVLAESSATIHYKLARLQTFAQGQWWHALLLIVAVLAASSYAVWMYRKDSVELPRGFAVLLCLLRLCALAGILFYFFGLEKRAERKLVKNSRVLLLIDTSQSMGLRDPPEGGATNVPASMSRVEQIAAELANGPLIQRLREKHDVVAYRFDQAENPIEVASFPRKPTQQEIAEAQVSEEDRLNRIVAESRWLVYVAASVFGVSIIAGLVYVLTRGQSRNVPGARAAGTQPGESESWALLATMTTLIAALVILAVACLRGSEAGILAVVGLRPVRATPTAPTQSTAKSETAPPAIDWTAQLVPRGGETRIGDNLQFLVDKERGGPIAAIVLFTDGCNNAGSDCKIAASTARESLIPI